MSQFVSNIILKNLMQPLKFALFFNSPGGVQQGKTERRYMMCKGPQLEAKSNFVEEALLKVVVCAMCGARTRTRFAQVSDKCGFL